MVNPAIMVQPISLKKSVINHSFVIDTLVVKSVSTEHTRKCSMPLATKTSAVLMRPNVSHVVLPSQNRRVKLRTHEYVIKRVKMHTYSHSTWLQALVTR